MINEIINSLEIENVYYGCFSFGDLVHIKKLSNLMKVKIKEVYCLHLHILLTEIH